MEKDHEVHSPGQGREKSHITESEGTHVSPLYRMDHGAQEKEDHTCYTAIDHGVDSFVANAGLWYGGHYHQGQNGSVDWKNKVCWHPITHPGLTSWAKPLP